MKENLAEFIRFVATAGFAAVVNIASRIALSQFLSFEWAVFFAYFFGMLTAYLLSRRFVFSASGLTVEREMAGFIVVNIIAIAQVWVVSVLFYNWILPAIEWNYRPALVAHIIGVISPVFTSYFGHKYISFRKIT